MCEPITISTGIGLAIAAAGAVAGGVSQANASAANSAIADKNAQLAEFAAQDSERRGETQAALARMKGSQTIGQARAAYGASGVDVGSGTPTDVVAESRLNSEMDAQIQKNNAMREAWGFRNQRNDFTAQAAQARAKGASEVAGTVLTTAANMYGILSK